MFWHKGNYRRHLILLTLLLSLHALALAEGLPQTQLENAVVTEVSSEIRIWVSKNIVSYPIQAKPPLTLVLDASPSTGGNLEFHWDFGDGTTATGARVEHTYTQEGDYQLTLKVSNDVDKKTLNFAIEVRQEPSIEIVDIPFSIDETMFNMDDIRGILSNYAYIFSPAAQGTIQAERYDEKSIYYDQRSVYDVSLFSKDSEIVAEDIVLPSHPQIIEFTHENSIRASLFLFLQAGRSVIKHQYGNDALMEFYEALYPQLDDSADFQALVAEMNRGDIIYNRGMYYERIANLLEKHVLPIVDEYYDKLSSDNTE